MGFMVVKEAATQGFLRVHKFPCLYHCTSALYTHFSHVPLTMCNLSNWQRLQVIHFSRCLISCMKLFWKWKWCRPASMLLSDRMVQSVSLSCLLYLNIWLFISLTTVAKPRTLHLFQMKPTRCTLLLSIFISTSLHVSGDYVPIIRRIYFICTTLIFFTLYVAVWSAGCRPDSHPYRVKNTTVA
jgi:hypothetical protein